VEGGKEGRGKKKREKKEKKRAFAVVDWREKRKKGMQPGARPLISYVQNLSLHVWESNHTRKEGTEKEKRKKRGKRDSTPENCSQRQRSELDDFPNEARTLPHLQRDLNAGAYPRCFGRKKNRPKEKGRRKKKKKKG